MRVASLLCNPEMEVQISLVLSLVAERLDMKARNFASRKTLLATSALCNLSGTWEKDVKFINALTS